MVLRTPWTVTGNSISVCRSQANASTPLSSLQPQVIWTFKTQVFIFIPLKRIFLQNFYLHFFWSSLIKGVEFLCRKPLNLMYKSQLGVGSSRIIVILYPNKPIVNIGSQKNAFDTTPQGFSLTCLKQRCPTAGKITQHKAPSVIKQCVYKPHILSHIIRLILHTRACYFPETAWATAAEHLCCPVSQESTILRISS